MATSKSAPRRGFWSRNKAYILVLLGFALLTYWYFWLATIADIQYVYRYFLQMLHGNFTGQLIPFDSLTHYQQMEVGLFGPRYDAIAPEVIRAFRERQEILPYVFAVEFTGFLIAFILQGGRKKATVTHPEDKVQVYSLFQRFVILLNILLVLYLFVTGFSITFGNWTGGGLIPRYMRMTHELVGLAWIPIWLIVTIIAFKDLKFFVRPSSRLFGKIFLKGRYTPMKRINYLAFVAFGFILIVSGFLLWYLYPDPKTHAQIIQFKRLMLFMHFMGSAIISFFLFETVYTYFVSVQGYLPAVITGKVPREYLEQLAPDILEEIEGYER